LFEYKSTYCHQEVKTIQAIMKFLVIEGLDGSGKSTQVKRIKAFLEAEKIKYKYIHFPVTDSPIFGEMVARFLRGDLGKLDQVDPYVVALLYAGDRQNAAQQLRQWMNEGYLILADRYVFGNIAFQCAKIEDQIEKEKLADWIFNMEFNHFKIPKPDVSIFLDVPFSFTKQKLTEERDGDDRDYLQGKEDIHEQDLDFQEKVRQVYVNETEKHKDFNRLSCAGEDGNMLSPDLISEKLQSLLKEYL